MKVTGSYLGRPGRYAQGRRILSNPCSDAWLNVQESAEAIVPWKGEVPEQMGVRTEREGPNNGSLTSERSVKQYENAETTKFG